MKKRTNVLTRVAAVVLSAAIAFGGVVATPEFAQTAHAANFVEGNLPVVSSVDEGVQVGGLYSQHLSFDKINNDTKGYFKFTLGQDSWVHFTGSYTNCNTDYAGSDIKIYADPSMSTQVIDYAFGMGRGKSNAEGYDFLRKGTYYGYVYSVNENFPKYEGDVNIVGYSIPISTIFKIKQQKKKGKTYVKMEDTLGTYAKGVQYINKTVSKANLEGSNVWKIKAFNWIGGDKKAKMMGMNTNGVYQFKAKKTSKYTIMIEDTKGNRYQKSFKVKVKK